MFNTVLFLYLFCIWYQLVDDSSRFKFGFGLVLRSDAPAAITRFAARWNFYADENSRSSHLSRLHSDAAGEFRAAAFLDLLANENIDKSFAPPEVHQLNGVAERAIRTIFLHVRADLVASGAPKKKLAKNREILHRLFLF